MAMQLNEVKLHNFGPYYGEHTVVFGGTRPIVLIHGDNMRGKTSFLNAIRWALYGHAKDRTGRDISYKNLLNWDAYAEEDWTMSVSINFDVDGIVYDLTRAIQPKKPAMKPFTNNDFEEKLFLKKEHQHLNPDEAQTEINRILPEQISRFFLFDGELLNEYEALLSRAETQSSLIRESIEHILGVPALTNTIADLKLNLKDAARRHRKLAREDSEAKVYATEAATIESEIEALEADVTELKGQRDILIQQQRVLDEQLQATAGIETDAERLSDIRDEIKRLQNEEEQLLVDKRNKLSDAWRDLLQPPIKSRLEQLESEREKQFKSLTDTIALKTQLGDMVALSPGKPCPICSRETNDIDKQKIDQKKDEILDKLSKLDYQEDNWIQASQSIKKLRLISPAGVAESIKYIERRLIELRVSLVDLEGKRDDLNERLMNHDYAIVIRNRRKYEEVTKEIGVLDNLIPQKEKAIIDKQNEASRIRAQISQVSGPAMEQLNREVQIYEQLIALYEQALKRLRDNLRLSVEKDATEIFRELTTDKSYTGLQINDYYGLTILDSKGGEIQVRSAGAEQVVALSLIGALNRNAVRHGPIVMDTPFGRLDPSHRENILKFIPTMANQVTLLVHGGEIDRTRDLEHIKDGIDKEYVIEFVTSTKSKIIAQMED